MPFVLVFSDVAPMTFPYPTTMATAVTSTMGPAFSKDVISNRSILVVNKSDNTPATVSSYGFAQKSDGTVSEIARTNWTADATMTKGTLSFGTLRVDPVTSVSTIENVLEADHESCIITSTSTADTTQEMSTAISYNGVSFSTDDACISFGGQQQFRIRFANAAGPNGSNLLVMEAKNSITGLYVTKTSISDEV